MNKFLNLSISQTTPKKNTKDKKVKEGNASPPKGANTSPPKGANNGNPPAGARVQPTTTTKAPSPSASNDNVQNYAL